MKSIIIKYLLALLTVGHATTACNIRTSLLPSVSGNEGDLLVVTTQSDWDGELGVTIRDSLTQEYPYLPSVEPMFDLSHASPKGFTDLYHTFRSILIVNIDPKEIASRVIYKTNVWAAPQAVIKLNAPSREEALKAFKENCRDIITFLENMERDRIISNIKAYEDQFLAPKVREMIGGSPYFPHGYKLKAKRNNFIWISHETQYIQQSILIFKYPIIEGVDMMASENLRAATDRLLKENVPGMFENTYMIITPIIDPYIGYNKSGNNIFAEMKGLWEVYGDYMGGPFVSHTYYAPDGKNMVTLFAFAYAPKYDKRTYMRQLEAILCSFKWNNE